MISIVIPVFGGGGNIRELLSRVDQLYLHRGMPTPEIVLIDDCGPQDSWDVLSECCHDRPNTIAIRLMRNFGQHNALMCGFQHATGSIIVTMDDDLQHEPESIPRLVEHLEQTNADVVYGVYDSKKHTGGRNLGSWLVNQFYRIVFRMPVTVTSFRVIRMELVRSILKYNLNFTYIDGLLAWNTQRIEMVSVPHHERADGKSSYTFGKLFGLAMNVFTNFSLLPLQMVSFVGIVAATGGIGLAFWYLFGALFAQVGVPGYASTIVAVLVLGGLQLLSLGIIGEYVGRLHLNVNRKPQYAIRQVIGDAPNRPSPGSLADKETSLEPNQ